MKGFTLGAPLFAGSGPPTFAFNSLKLGLGRTAHVTNLDRTYLSQRAFITLIET